MTIRTDIVDAMPQVTVHAQHHNDLATIANSLLPGGALSLADHVAAADPHPVYLNNARGDARYDLAGVANTAMTVHLAAADPHPTYLNTARGDARYQPLGASTFPAGITVTGNSTITGALSGITTLTATTLAGTLSTAAQPTITIAESQVTSLVADLALKATLAAPSFTGGITVTGAVTLATAVSQVIPGATSLSLRNHANSADNLILTDAGVATIRGGLTVTAGGEVITAGGLQVALGNVGIATAPVATAGLTIAAGAATDPAARVGLVIGAPTGGSFSNIGLQVGGGIVISGIPTTTASTVGLTGVFGSPIGGGVAPAPTLKGTGFGAGFGFGGWVQISVGATVAYLPYYT